MPLFIYADNIKGNIRKIKKQSKKEIIAVVKSNAYGIGSKYMIDLLKKEKVSFFAFDKFSEYFNNENQLEDSKVLIMESPTLSLINRCTTPNVRFSINSLLDAYNIKDIDKKINVHLQIDTGMNRIGIRSIKECLWIIKMLEANKNTKIEGIYTHFSSNFYESNYYVKQLNLFKKYLDIYPFEVIHANATKTLHKKLIGNHIRIGMALFGYNQPNYNLVPSLSIRIKPTNIFKTESKDLIGYQQLHPRPLMATINLGYNDLDFTNIKYIYNKKEPYEIFAKSCMNHTHLIVDDKINYLTWLSIFPTNDIIVSSDDYDWYRILISTKSMPKNYIMRRYYDIPKIFKSASCKSFRTKFRKRGSKIISS